MLFKKPVPIDNNFVGDIKSQNKLHFRVCHIFVVFLLFKKPVRIDNIFFVTLKVKISYISEYVNRLPLFLSYGMTQSIGNCDNILKVTPKQKFQNSRDIS